jgi:uncharacterized membrane protein
MPEISMFCPGCGQPVKATAAISAGDAREAILGALAYVAVIPAILFLTLPALRNRYFVRFHAWQSLFFAVSTAVTVFVLKFVFAALSILPWIGFLVAWLSVGLVSLAVLALWAALVVKALQGQSYELPGIGPMAAELAK